MDLGNNISFTLDCWSSARNKIDGEITYLKYVDMVLNEARFQIEDLVWIQFYLEIDNVILDYCIA